MRQSTCPARRCLSAPSEMIKRWASGSTSARSLEAKSRPCKPSSGIWRRFYLSHGVSQVQKRDIAGHRRQPCDEFRQLAGELRPNTTTFRCLIETGPYSSRQWSASAQDVSPARIWPSALLDQIVHHCTELRLTSVKMGPPRRRRFVQVQAAIHLNHDGAHS